MLNNDELKELKNRLECNNVYEEENDDKEPKKHINLFEKLKFLFKKYVYCETI